MEAANKQHVLSIESAISGGSMALFDGSELILERSGSESLARAEDLLPNIIEILDEARLSKQQLKRIAVSTGPGSYTGLRVGIATVMGLCKGLGVEYVGLPIFNAIFASFGEADSVAAVPMGRTDICIASGAAPDAARVISSDQIREVVEFWGASRLLVHAQLVSTFSQLGVETIDIGTNLARYVGAASTRVPSSGTLFPIYIQNPRFG